MKKLLLLFSFVLLYGLAFTQAQYDGALERYKMKSDEAVKEGLIGEYYSGADFNKLVRVKQDKEIYFDWNYSNPIPELGSDYFSIRWRGKVYSQKEGKYIFTAYTDDGMRIWLNGRLIINAWKDQPPTLYEARVILEKDEFYDIRVDYYQKEYQTTAAVFFNPEGEERRALNAGNTLFGKNLRASTAKFDFWEDKGLLEDFWTWIGLEEPKVEKPFIDQSFRVENNIEDNMETVREEQSDDKKEMLIPTKQKIALKSQKSEIVKEIKINKADQDSLENRYENMLPGETLIVENIYFDQGKAYLRPESFKELDQLLTALTANPKWNIKIDGHTDNVGYAALNLELSFDRARSVYFYLINNGVEKSRLKFEGFGSSRPLVKNDSEENKQKNRRVEVSLIEENITSLN